MPSPAEELSPAPFRSLGRDERELSGNTATGTLKLIALAFMFIDHLGASMFTNVTELRILGRIAFPIYCWCLVVGFHYTRSVPKYLLRILLVGIISQPFYMLALHPVDAARSLPALAKAVIERPVLVYDHSNIMLTLIVALLGLAAIRAKWYGSHIWGPIAALILAEVLKVNYGWRGVMFVLLLYAAQERRSALAAVIAAFCLFWGASSSSVKSICGLDLSPLLTAKYFGAIFTPLFKLQGLAVLSLPFILIRLKRSVKLPTWLGYALYPAHLILLWGLLVLCHR